MTIKEFNETTTAFIRNMPIGLWRKFRSKCELLGITSAQGAIEALRDWIDKE